MATFRYPQNDFDRPEVLREILGSFWATTYRDSEFVGSYATATGYDAQQTYRQLMELVNTVSRYDVPIYHEEAWYALVVRESAIRRNIRPLTYELSGPTYDNFGKAFGSSVLTEFFHVDKPRNLSHVPYIFERLIQPSVAWANGVEYELGENEIRFRRNPFEDSRIPQRDVLSSSGQIVDREITLWLYRGEWDWDTVYRQFGYALELRMRTSDGYKEFVNAIFDGLSFGTSKKLQAWALAAVFGIPISRENGEIVEDIRTDLGETCIVTNKNTYVFPSTANPVVSVGDVLDAGTFVTDILRIFELNRGETPTADELISLTLEEGMLSHGYWHGLTFVNDLVSTTIEENVDGYTKISWPLGGFSLDVEKFWVDTHTAGVNSGKTLAMCLDQRSAPVGQPFAACLPAYVNPLQFLIRNYLRSNAFIVKLKASTKRENALEFIPHTCLAKILPPHTVMLFVVELVLPDKPIIMVDDGTELAPGYTENLSGFSCIVQAESIDPTTTITEKLFANAIGGHCV